MQFIFTKMKSKRDQDTVNFSIENNLLSSKQSVTMPLLVTILYFLGTF